MGSDAEDSDEGGVRRNAGAPAGRSYHELSSEQQFLLLKKRLAEYSRKAHKKVKRGCGGLG